MTETDTGTGYTRPPATYRAQLTEVGRGTPMGELLRRYWHPVGLETYATDLPRMVRALGEDLVLFRDKQGRPGLVHPRCAHRGSSLFYGRVEEEGIRCCYHGWLFDRRGNCLDQPGEPDGGAEHRGKVRQPWYPVEERYGLIWAYMGPPERKPLLPKYDVLEELGESEQLFTDDSNIGSGGPGEYTPFNWFQHYENIHDQAHFFWLHFLHSGPQFGTRFGELDDLEKLRRDLPDLVASVQTYQTPRGLAYRRHSRLADGRTLQTVVETVLPTIRGVANPLGKLGRIDQIGWVLPVDDTNFKIFTVLRDTDRSYFERFEKMRAAIGQNRTVEYTQRFPGDYEAQGSQGPITLHSEENLRSSDRGIVQLRRLFEQQIKRVEAGDDPIGVHFEPGDEWVCMEAGADFVAQIAAE